MRPMKKYYLGIDVGSVSTNLVLLDDQGGLVYRDYLKTMGQPDKSGAGRVEDSKGKNGGY
jgi:activator of 2-hydroxyglutaryl-CoA dehydratase